MKISLPPFILLDDLLKSWLLEDLGRGDRSTQGLFNYPIPLGQGEWIAKAEGIVAGLPIAQRIFYLLNPQIQFTALVAEGEKCEIGQAIASIEGKMDSLLMGERVALNIAMHLSGIATSTRLYVDAIGDLSTHFVDTRKTTPGMRILEKYATEVGGGQNHRMGLDDTVMIKDNHIKAAGGITQAVIRIRKVIPYPLTIEVETSNLEEVKTALEQDINIIMLDNMSIADMTKAVKLIRDSGKNMKIEASGNITLANIKEIAQTGVDYISSSAPITRSKWLDISMKLKNI
jgi:nicotinate-nucleotide pyrophosphorylase (carboxylating)